MKYAGQPVSAHLSHACVFIVFRYYILLNWHVSHQLRNMTSPNLFFLVSMTILCTGLPSGESFASNKGLDDVSVDWFTADVYEGLEADMYIKENTTSGINSFTDAVGSDFVVNRNEAHNKPSLKKGFLIYKPMVEVMRRPEMSEFLGQVLPIIRSMSPPQKLILAALLSAHLVSSPSTPLSVEHVVSMIGTSSVYNKDVPSGANLSSQLLLPISIDIAKMFHRATRDTLRPLKAS